MSSPSNLQSGTSNVIGRLGRLFWSIFRRSISQRAPDNNPCRASVSPISAVETSISQTLIKSFRWVKKSRNNHLESLFLASIVDAHELMVKLLTMPSPPNSLSSPSRIIGKIQTIKYFGFTSRISSFPKSLDIKKKSSLFDGAPLEVCEMIFSKLDCPEDLINCSNVCQTWKDPSQNALKQLIKRCPYAGLSLLQSLRLGLKLNRVFDFNSVKAMDTIRKLSVDYCQSNPALYLKFSPRNPESMIYQVFVVFFLLHQSVHISGIGNQVCYDFQDFVQLFDDTVCFGIDKELLKSLYKSIKATPLV